MSISYTTLEQSERKKPKLESQHFPTSSSSPMQPCRKYTAQERSAAPTTLEQSKRKKLKLDFAANERLLYYSQTKRKEEAKARIPALPYIQLFPHACSLAVNKHSTLPKKQAAPTILEQNQKKNYRASLFHCTNCIYTVHLATQPKIQYYMCIYL